MQSRIPTVVDRLCDKIIEESQGQLLGQRADREPLGTAKSRQTLWQEIRHSSRGDGRGDRLAKLLQSLAFAFNAELCQPNEIRAKLVRGPERNNAHVNDVLRDTRNRGKVTATLAQYYRGQYA